MSFCMCILAHSCIAGKRRGKTKVDPALWNIYNPLPVSLDVVGEAPSTPSNRLTWDEKRGCLNYLPIYEPVYAIDNPNEILEEKTVEEVIWALGPGSYMAWPVAVGESLDTRLVVWFQRVAVSERASQDSKWNASLETTFIGTEGVVGAGATKLEDTILKPRGKLVVFCLYPAGQGTKPVDLDTMRKALLPRPKEKPSTLP